MIDLPNKCPVCKTPWTKMQSPFIAGNTYVFCKACDKKASAIMDEYPTKSKDIYDEWEQMVALWDQRNGFYDGGEQG